MRHKLRYILPLIGLLPLAGCIKNDIPFPHIPQLILSIAAEGESAPAKIDDKDYSVVISLEETTDIYNVRFSDFTFTEGASASENLLEGTYDLSRPLSITLESHYPYVWTISAVQEIERRFEVSGQIGSSVIDVPGRRIVLKVPSTENLADLTLTDIKLGPEGLTTLSPGLTGGQKINLVSPMEIDVTYFGRTQHWTVYAEKTELLINTSQVDAWSQVIWAYGEAPEGGDFGFRYRIAGSEGWEEVAKSEITVNGGSFSACIRHLSPLTEYEVQAYSGEDSGQIVKVTTQATLDIPGGDFSGWSLDGKIWNPWAEGATPYWSTGNKGAATVGESNVTPSDHTPDNTGKAARLLTEWKVLKLAAGSIFTGSYVRTDGTNGVLAFGRPWNVRPTKLKGYFQYNAKPIDRTDNSHAYLKGRPDSCHIYVAVTDWTAPLEIRTNPQNQQLFDPASPSVIAYGELVYSGEMNGYKPFEIVLDYRSTSRVPTYMLITCAASKYGDFFTGGVNSELFVDQFSFSYDY